MNIFVPADILLPKVKSWEKWSVVACDQFSAQPEYWQRVRKTVGDEPSTMHLILPEAELGAADEDQRVEKIHERMREYIEKGLFDEYQEAFIYVERTLASGMIRKGLVGMIDLEAYDYRDGAKSPIRCTEKTVTARIPPRMKVRQNAALELPHVLLLCDDGKKQLIEPIAQRKEELPLLYDFSLMEDGGRVQGWLVQGQEAAAFEERLDAFAKKAAGRYPGISGEPVVFAVGDGNHSLATAKACYEKRKAEDPEADWSGHPARYALVELENIQDEAQEFEPIHRIVFNTEPERLLEALEKECGAADGHLVQWHMGERSGEVRLSRAKGELAVGVLQSFLDAYLQEHAGEVDYIHGDEELKMLAGRPGAIGFMLPVMEKSQLFRGVMADGALPRKTFSMGSAQEKRYYLECRKIQ